MISVPFNDPDILRSPRTLSAPSSAPDVLGHVPVGVDGLGEEWLVPVRTGLGCDPLIGVVSGAQVRHSIAASAWGVLWRSKGTE